MSEDTAAESLITLDFLGTEVEFLTLEEITEFLQSEKSQWAWLEQATRQDTNLSQVWRPFSSLYGQLNQFVQQSQQHQNNENQLTNLATVFVNMVVASTQAALFSSPGSARSGFSQASSARLQFLMRRLPHRSGLRCLASL